MLLTQSLSGRVFNSHRMAPHRFLKYLVCHIIYLLHFFTSLRSVPLSPRVTSYPVHSLPPRATVVRPVVLSRGKPLALEFGGGVIAPPVPYRSVTLEGATFTTRELGVL